MMNYVAPAGTPIRFRDILHWANNLSASRHALDEFNQGIRERFDVKHCFFISSGRAALYLTLLCLARHAGNIGRREVIIPSYTCYSVPAAIARAGLRVRVCDILPETLSYDLNSLASFDLDNVLAVITSNLYGIPNDLPAISRLAAQQGVYLIDDAAQSMGATIAGRYSGTYGDVGIFSLDKGKNITSIQGGIIVTNSDELARELGSAIEALPSQSVTSLLTEITKLLIYAALLPPHMYWITRFIPFLNLGKTVYTMNYPVRQYSSAMGALALWLFTQLDEINEHRKANASWLYEHLDNIPDITFPRAIWDANPVYVRLPVLM
jgi:perosamine synthetase